MERTIVMTDSKVAIVTGASQGIGEAIAVTFLQRGYAVVGTSRKIAPADSELYLTVAGDIADPLTANQVVAAALERFGRIDTLVNNAGIFMAKPFVEFTREDFDAMIGTNVAGFFHMTQAVARRMLAQGIGHIINITTTLVDQPMAGVPTALTALTKGGLDAVVRTLAIEYAQKGVRVNAVSPGIINTPMHKPEVHGAMAALHPMQRMGTVEEIVDAVLYLEGAAFVTGETLHVDGGQHAGRW
jgi:NAD(P)-dependent dehydrogenase (short-subunit alcohol dehydrogenase family)